MHDFIKVFLSLSVSGSLLTLLILLLKPLYKDKLSRKWQYYIWLVAALRFLIPIAPDTTLVGTLFTLTAPVTSDNLPVFKDTLSTAALPYIGTVLFLLWVIPASVLFIRKINTYHSFLSFLKAGNTKISNPETLKLLTDCLKRQNIKSHVELYCNLTITSPVMTGFFHPAIILPAEQTDSKQLTPVFMHELTHYKRMDMFYKWFIQIVISLHWFNPFVYLLKRETNKACELSCDEAVISSLDQKGKKAYGDMLLSFLKAEQTNKNSYVPLALTNGAEQIKERLGAIMNFKKKSKTTVIITIISTIAICICFIVIGAYIVPSPASENTPVEGNLTNSGENSNDESKDASYVWGTYEYSPEKSIVIEDALDNTLQSPNEESKNNFYVETYEYYSAQNGLYLPVKKQ